MLLRRSISSTPTLFLRQACLDNDGGGLREATSIEGYSRGQQSSSLQLDWPGKGWFLKSTAASSLQIWAPALGVEPALHFETGPILSKYMLDTPNGSGEGLGPAFEKGLNAGPDHLQQNHQAVAHMKEGLGLRAQQNCSRHCHHQSIGGMDSSGLSARAAM